MTYMWFLKNVDILEIAKTTKMNVKNVILGVLQSVLKTQFVKSSWINVFVLVKAEHKYINKSENTKIIIKRHLLVLLLLENT